MYAYQIFSHLICCIDNQLTHIGFSMYMCVYMCVHVHVHVCVCVCVHVVLNIRATCENIIMLYERRPISQWCVNSWILHCIDSWILHCIDSWLRIQKWLNSDHLNIFNVWKDWLFQIYIVTHILIPPIDRQTILNRWQVTIIWPSQVVFVELGKY